MDLSSFAALAAMVLFFALIWALGAVCIKAGDHFHSRATDSDGFAGTADVHAAE